MVGGEIKEEIMYSVYGSAIKTVVIFCPSDSYRYEVAGTEEGTYGLDIASIEDGEATTFTATDIPTTSDAVHQYTIDWDALSRGKEGVTVQIDSDGDGEFEQSGSADSELIREEFEIISDATPPAVFLSTYPSKVVFGDTPKVDVSFSWTGLDNITPTDSLVYQYKLEYSNEVHALYESWSKWTSGTSVSYQLPSGSYIFKVRAKDKRGNFPVEDDTATAKYSFTVTLPIIAYPNPCHIGHHQAIKISNLPSGSKVCIYTVSGELVRVLDDSNEIIEEGGSRTAIWDCRNDDGEEVARGIYIYFIPKASGDRRTGKIAIIK